MTKNQFLDVKTKLPKFHFTSLLFTEYEELVDYEILLNKQNVIILYGFNAEDRNYEFHWACNNVQELLEGLVKKNNNEKITFVPKEWIKDLMTAGFEIQAVWNDYFSTDLETYANYVEPVFVNESNYIEASEVTRSCAGGSRGFAGQSKEWMKQWINNLEPAVPDYASSCTVLAECRNEMIGVVCIGIYGEKDKTTLWIREIAVKPEFRRQGIARKLLGQAFAYGQRHGVKRAFLLVDECNDIALQLYKSMGFAADSEEGQIDMIR